MDGQFTRRLGRRHDDLARSVGVGKLVKDPTQLILAKARLREDASVTLSSEMICMTHMLAVAHKLDKVLEVKDTILVGDLAEESLDFRTLLEQLDEPLERGKVEVAATFNISLLEATGKVGSRGEDVESAAQALDFVQVEFGVAAVVGRVPMLTLPNTLAQVGMIKAVHKLQAYGMQCAQ